MWDVSIPASEVEDFFEKLHRVGDDHFAVAGDGVVFAFDHLEAGFVAVGLQILLAAPHGDDAVVVSMQKQYLSRIG